MGRRWCIVYFDGAFAGTEYGDGIEICRIFHFIFAGSFYYGRVSVLFCEKRAFQKGDYPAGDFAGWNFRIFRVQGSDTKSAGKSGGSRK